MPWTDRVKWYNIGHVWTMFNFVCFLHQVSLHPSQHMSYQMKEYADIKQLYQPFILFSEIITYRSQL